jgi:hypothetical protein
LQGAAGAQGLQGPIGSQGAPGVAGAQGLQGDAGVAGPQGLQGPIGPQGAQGDLGPQGTTGAQGIAGPTGPQGTTGSQGIQGATGPQGPVGPQGALGPVPPTLIGPSDVAALLLLQIPGVTPRVPSQLNGHSSEFEIFGSSGYSLTTSGATPIIVLSRPANVDSAIFLNAVVDQHPLTTQGPVVITTVNAQGTTVVNRLILNDVRVDAVATGWVSDVIVLRYSTLTEQFADNSTTAAIAANLNDSVAPDFSAALASDCGLCTGVFRANAQGQSNVTNFTTWNESNGWTYFFTHTATGTSVRAQTSLVPNATTTSVVKALALQTTQTRFETNLLKNGNQQLVPVRFSCSTATFSDLHRGTDDTMQFNATVSGCTGFFQRYNAQGAPAGQPVTVTSP